MSLPNRLLDYISESAYLEDEKHRKFKCESIDLTLSVADIYQCVENEEMQRFRQNQAIS
jgi:hypothetical protein